MTIEDAIRHLNSVAGQIQMVAISTQKPDLAAKLAQAIVDINRAIAELEAAKTL